MKGQILLAGLGLVAVQIAGAESLTMTTYYPAPMGVYRNLTSTQQTRLARDNGTLAVGAFSVGYPINVAYKLDVDGDLRARNITAGIITADDFRHTDGSPLGYWAPNGSGIHNMNGGYVGIGISNPQFPLSVGDMGTGHPLQLDAMPGTNNEMVFSRNGTLLWEAGLHNNDAFVIHYNPDETHAKIAITKGGNVNVGGGTENPVEKLQVEGNIYLSTDGSGIIVRSPSGTACGKYGVKDDGSWDFVPNVPCP